METPNNNTQLEKGKTQLYEYPWLALLAVVVTTAVSIILANKLVLWIGLSPPRLPVSLPMR